MIIQRKRGLQAVLVLMPGHSHHVGFCPVRAGHLQFFTSIIWRPDRPLPHLCLCHHGGLFLESFQRDQAGVELSPFEESFPRQHQLSLRQTLYAMGALFVYLVVTKDGTISRIFLALCLPMFYLTLLWSNRYLSRRLANLSLQRRAPRPRSPDRAAAKALDDKTVAAKQGNLRHSNRGHSPRFAG
jgi:hypothetical protein